MAGGRREPAARACLVGLLLPPPSVTLREELHGGHGAPVTTQRQSRRCGRIQFSGAAAAFSPASALQGSRHGPARQGRTAPRRAPSFPPRPAGGASPLPDGRGAGQGRPAPPRGPAAAPRLGGLFPRRGRKRRARTISEAAWAWGACRSSRGWARAPAARSPALPRGGRPNFKRLKTCYDEYRLLLKPGAF